MEPGELREFREWDQRSRGKWGNPGARIDRITMEEEFRKVVKGT